VLAPIESCKKLPAQNDLYRRGQKLGREKLGENIFIVGSYLGSPLIISLLAEPLTYDVYSF
jgi:hypothetical protein